MESASQSKHSLIAIIVGELHKWIGNYVDGGYDMAGFILDILIDGDEPKSDRAHVMIMCDWRATMFAAMLKALKDPEKADKLKALLKS